MAPRLLLAPFLAVLVLGGPEAGRATITRAELQAHVAVLAAPENEGRDSPSLGLERAARYIAERFAAAGLGCAPDAPRTGAEGASGEEQRVFGPSAEALLSDAAPLGPAGCSFLREFSFQRPEPVAEGCALALLEDGAEVFRLGRDFVPALGCDGEAEGELHFAGYGIRDKQEGWDDLGQTSLRGKIALILEGEPDHPRRFEGPELSAAASLWRKLTDLGALDVAGVLVVRRQEASERIAFRPSWADFVGGERVPPPRKPPPALELTRAAAERLLGEELAPLERGLDGRSRPKRRGAPARRVRFSAATRPSERPVHNVVGWLEGADPALASEVVVVGAHYDHLGVDARGRIALGADDNASGTAVLIELAEAFAAARPRRSLCLVAFAAEEHGLVGSRAFVARPPVAPSSMVAMINLDMVGRGDAREVAVIGLSQNPSLGKLLERARKLSRTGVTKLATKGGEELFERSDHFSFHRAGVPILFFFEGLPISRNADYHTWRDVPERLDYDKVLATALLTFNAAWLLADDDERPPRPRD